MDWIDKTSNEFQLQIGWIDRMRICQNSSYSGIRLNSIRSFLESFLHTHTQMRPRALTIFYFHVIPKPLDLSGWFCIGYDTCQR